MPHFDRLKEHPRRYTSQLQEELINNPNQWVPINEDRFGVEKRLYLPLVKTRLGG